MKHQKIKMDFLAKVDLSDASGDQITTLFTQEKNNKLEATVLRDNVTGKRYLVVTHTHGAVAIQKL